MSLPILVSLDSNEQGSPRATALALAVGGDPAYELQGFAELPVDMACERVQADKDWVSRKVYVELKEIPDFWASKSSGHLGQQILEMVAAGSPGFVAVFGSLQEVLQAVPKVKLGSNPSGMKKPQHRSQMDIQQDISTARAFCADAAGCGVPVFFLDRDRDIQHGGRTYHHPGHRIAFQWILSLAKNILIGPNMSSWLPRYPVEPRGYQVLCSISGIGDVAAKGLLRAYGGIAQISSEAKLNPSGLAGCMINGRALGKAKAAKIVEVLG